MAPKCLMKEISRQKTKKNKKRKKRKNLQDIGGCSHRNPEPRAHRSSKLLGRNLMFNLHSVVCTNSLDTISHLSFMESLI